MLEQPAKGQRVSADPDLQSGRVEIIGLEPERRAQLADLEAKATAL
jgi:hypothetical protein